jgi:hypothetical protein
VTYPLGDATATECQLSAFRRHSERQKSDQDESGDGLSADMGYYTASTRGQAHRPQAAQHDKCILLWRHKGHSNVHGQVNLTDYVGLGLRIAIGGYVSRSCPFTRVFY